MLPISALVAAASAACLPCQRSATPAVLAGDRLAITAISGMAMSAFPGVPAALSPASHRVWLANREMIDHGDGDGSRLRTLVEEMSEEELSDLLEDALDLWAGLAAISERHNRKPEAAEAPDRSEREGRPEPELTRVPDNPFGELLVGMMTLENVQAAGGFPLPVLLQSAVTGTVDDAISEHAHDFFETLDERGAGAWREAGLLLVQYLLSGGQYGVGREAAQAYLAQQPPAHPRIPSLTGMHQAMAAFMASGRPAADRVLAGLPEKVLAGTVRMLFTTTVTASGYPRTKARALFEELCADVH